MPPGSSQCCSKLQINSTGLVKQHYPSTLGAYEEYGISNGWKKYKHPGGSYLHYDPHDNWLVRNLIPLASDTGCT